MEKITIEATVNAPVEKVWQYWSLPEHIKNWAFADSSWHAPHAENDLKIGGEFTTTMAAKDGSAGFNFGGVYTAVEEHKIIAYKMNDGRTVDILFNGDDKQTKITETFDPETENPVEMQKQGWQSILDNFKKYTEEN